jgi:hypothetical protein
MSFLIVNALLGTGENDEHWPPVIHHFEHLA